MRGNAHCPHASESLRIESAPRHRPDGRNTEVAQADWREPRYQAFAMLAAGVHRRADRVRPGRVTSMCWSNWPQYIAPWINDIAQIGQDYHVFIGITKIITGIAVALEPRYGAYVVAGIVRAGHRHRPASPIGYYDVAPLRDLGLMLAALALARFASIYMTPPARIRRR